jgi:UDPglucose 6-dehydrogenase
MKVAVYGLGKLGYPLLNVLARAGHETLGIDPTVSTWTVVAEEHRVVPPEHQEVEWGGTASPKFSTEPQAADVSFIVVPTPSAVDGGFDNGYVIGALEQIAQQNAQGHIAVIVSTVSPGTCDYLAENYPALTLVYNPTFIALGEVVRGLTQPDMLLLGAADQAALDVVDVLWQTVFVKEQVAGTKSRPYVHVGSFTEIELIKLSVNAALGTKISLANSLGALFELWGVNPRAVEVVGRDRRIGTEFFTPGSPISGPCLPRDNLALRAAAHEKGVELPLAKATDLVNDLLLESIHAKVRAHNPATVGILGMSYKYGSDVTEAAPGPWLRDRLAGGVRLVLTYDKQVPGGDGLAAVLAADVVVVTQREYRDLIPEVWNGKVVELWPT